jgi:hypothetical protein
LAASKRFEEFIDRLCAIILSHGTNDTVPIQIGSAINVIDLEFRLKTIVPRGIPNQISGSGFFLFPNLHQANTSS